MARDRMLEQCEGVSVSHNNISLIFIRFWIFDDYYRVPETYLLPAPGAGALLLLLYRHKAVMSVCSADLF